MSYMLRDRPDGQVEIVLSRPVLIGIFPDPDVAARVCAWLQADEPELPADEAAVFARATADVAEAEGEDYSEFLSRHVDRFGPGRPVQLPAVVEDQRTPTVLAKVSVPRDLTEAQIDAAFSRIASGEKLARIAPDYGLSMGQLRGMWANHKRQLQKHLAEGGQQPCALCQKPFTPSVSNPDTCARCSHG